VDAALVPLLDLPYALLMAELGGLPGVQGLSSTIVMKHVVQPRPLPTAP
jgi:hypothetical protein